MRCEELSVSIADVYKLLLMRPPPAWHSAQRALARLPTLLDEVVELCLNDGCVRARDAPVLLQMLNAIKALLRLYYGAMKAL